MAVAVGIGLMEFPFSSVKSYWRWVDMCEAGGIDSLWQTDRLISREPILECMTALAAIAGRTRRIKFGMNVVSLALRDPVLVAKQCATIDVLSEGRMLPAFGIGSPMAPEWKALNADTRTRGARTDEGLEIIRKLWTEEKVDFEGKHYRLSGASIAPRPVQKELPMWIGGGSEAAIKRTARYGTGWQAGSEGPEEAGRIVAAIKAAAAGFGRKIDDDHYGGAFPFYFGNATDPAPARMIEAYKRRTGRDASTLMVLGGADEIVERVSAYVAHGIEKFIVRPVGIGDEALMAQTGRLIEEVLPEISRRWPKPKKAPRPA